MASTQRPSAVTLRLDRTFRAAPERVFQAWTTPEELRRWSAPGDMRVAVAEVDLRVGGRYRIDMEGPDGAVHRVGGTYREIDRPRRLAYTWRWEDKPGAFPETLVTVEFRARPDGGTHLVLVHEGLPDENSRQQHDHGWKGCLDKLEAIDARESA